MRWKAGHDASEMENKVSETKLNRGSDNLWEKHTTYIFFLQFNQCHHYKSERIQFLFIVGDESKKNSEQWVHKVG